jgi:carbon-monoxide dehydrogenase medium subunit
MLTLVTGVGARLQVLSSDGVSVLDADGFFSVDGGIRLGAAEILTAVRFPGVAAFDAVVFEKFRQRTFDAAVASVLCAVRSGPDGTLADLRLTVGAATPVPVQAVQTCAALLGRPAAGVDVAAVAAAVVEESLVGRGDSPSARYARELVSALTRRALTRALSTPRS